MDRKKKKVERLIVNVESTTHGKRARGNDDDLIIGKDFAAVIDGVSHKSKIETEDGKIIKIAQIITEAIRKIDDTNYAEIMDFNTFVNYVNWYIARYLEEHGHPEMVGQMEATGVIYSRHKNQIWLVGDCRAICDGQVIQNPLKIDEVYIRIRDKILENLPAEALEQLRKKDVTKTIIHHPETIGEHIKDGEKREKVEEYRRRVIRETLLECGFTDEEIEAEGLIKKYYNPRKIQAILKNKTFMGDYGYAVFNGRYTEQRNCRVVQLPETISTIKLFSDGFSVAALKNKKDIGHAIRYEWKKAANNPLGKGVATHPAAEYGPGAKEIKFDDFTAAVIRIYTRVVEIPEAKPGQRPVQETDEGR